MCTNYMIQDCKSKLTDVMREMDRVSRESTELEARCATMTVDVETAKSHNDTLQSQCNSLRHEVELMLYYINYYIFNRL